MLHDATGGRGVNEPGGRAQRLTGSAPAREAGTIAGPAGQHTVRRHNRALVLSRIGAAPGQTRVQLADGTGLTRATISALVDELIGSDLVVELPPTPARGRPASPLQLNPSGPAAVGIDINVDRTSACVLDLTGVVRDRRTLPADNSASTPRAGLRRACQLANALAASVGLPIAGVGVAVPGLVSARGTVHETPNLPRWSGADLRTPVGEMTGQARVIVDNEANLAALAERWYGTRLRDFVYVSGEIGVGGGLVLGGELFRGVRGFAGEIGHIQVDPAGPLCGCGNRGCLEQVAGKSAVLRAASAVNDDGLSRHAEAGDPRTLAALARTASALAVAVGAAINVVDVPAVVLGGFYARVGNWLAEPLAYELSRRLVSCSRTEVRVSDLGAETAMLGAAGSVLRCILASAG
jgi:predicted NBD/HSP70 family sugar kinase